MAILKLLLFLSVSFNLNSAIPVFKKAKNGLRFLEKEIINYKQSNKNLKNEITKFEKKLSKINRKHISILNNKSKAESKLIVIKDQYAALQLEVRQFLNLFERVKLQYFLDKSNDQEIDAKDLLVDSFYLKKLKQFAQKHKTFKLKQKNLSLDIQDQRKGVWELNRKLALFEELEKEWEQNKSRKVQLYLRQNKLISSYSDKISNLKNKRLRKLAPKLGFFNWPIKEYIGMKFKKKGITFSFDTYQDIKNGKAGKVAHVGKLSKYGTIVIIKHKGNLRSIYLGNYKAQIKIGDLLKQGDLIGMTSPKGMSQLGKLYFEIRKNNKPQQTINLLVKK